MDSISFLRWRKWFLVCFKSKNKQGVLHNFKIYWQTQTNVDKRWQIYSDRERISSGYHILLTQADSVTDVISEDTRNYNSHGIVCADFTAGGTAEIKPLSVEILRHNKRIRPCGCSWSMVKSRKPRVKNNFLWKEKATLKKFTE